MNQIATRQQMPFQNFEWRIPPTFNFARDVVDYWAANGDPLCLIWANQAGEEQIFTYSDMSRLTQRFAHSLREAGVGKGDRILVVMPRIPEWQIAIVAALRLGAVPIPSIEMLTAREVQYRAEHSGAKAAICRAGQVPQIEEGLSSVPIRFSVGPYDGWQDMSATLNQAEEFEGAEVAAEEPAIMYYTSGSTGYPKGVLHSARGLFTWRYSASHWLDLGPADRIWCTADTGWSKAGTSVLFGPWSQGATSFLYDGPFIAGERLELLSKYRVNVYCAPATELYRIVQEDISSHDLSALRRTVSAGEAMNPAVAEKWTAATGMGVAEAYGQTETLMIALTLAGSDIRVGSMGVSAPGSVLGIIDDEGRELEDGAAGHIALALPNPQLMLGYWNDPERTEGSFVEGPGGRWFITGDLGHRDAEGYFWYHGRSDDVINSAGYRIGPVEVENAIIEHDAVLECAVIGAPHEERGEVVKACLVLKEGYEPGDELAREIQDHVKQVTAPYKYPRIVEFRPALPKGPTGKILRRALRDEAKVS